MSAGSTLAKLGGLQLNGQFFCGKCQSLDDFPPSFFGSADDAVQSDEISSAFFGAKATEDFHAEFHHSQVAFGQIVGKRDAPIPHKPKEILFFILEP